MRRPSENRPFGEWKKVIPLGGGACPNAAERPPVSELESPKLKMALKLVSLPPIALLCISVIEITSHLTNCINFSDMVFVKRRTHI